MQPCLSQETREAGDWGEQAWGPCGTLPSPHLSSYQMSFLISSTGFEDLLGVQKGTHSWGLVVMRALLSPEDKC